jgi:hypothetical protein
MWGFSTQLAEREVCSPLTLFWTKPVAHWAITSKSSDLPPTLSSKPRITTTGKTFHGVKITRRLAFIHNLRIQRLSFLGTGVDIRVIRTKFLVPYSELAHDAISSDTIEPSVVPFSSLDLLQPLSLLSQTLLPPCFIFNLLLVICVDGTETSSDDIQDLLELIGQRYAQSSCEGSESATC